MTSFIEKLALLRAEMKEQNIDAYIIPSTDPNLGEYIPDHWRIISWLTGFTGSAATVIITDSFAGLWTDSRYFIQAENQLKGSGFELMKPVNTGKNDFIIWLPANMNQSSKIALDGRILSIERIRMITKSFGNNGISFDFSCDLISRLWTDRPPMPYSIAFDHHIGFCGIDRSAKIAEVRKQMKQKMVDYHLLTSSDDIMWLLNIRGRDTEYSPLIISFAIVGEEQILLFVDENKIPLQLASEFDKLGIVILSYEDTAGMLASLPPDSAILLNPSTTSSDLFYSIPEGTKIFEDFTIPTCLKAVKNSVEIENIGKAMIKDGVALTKFYFWFEQNSDSGTITEMSAGEKLNSLRSENDNYLGPSFSVIVAFKEHGALPHYSATSQSDRVITGDGILLIDSGGQYLDGTTDITRTVCIGKSTE